MQFLDHVLKDMNMDLLVLREGLLEFREFSHLGKRAHWLHFALFQSQVPQFTANIERFL
jgi:hypothetical protein